MVASPQRHAGYGDLDQRWRWWPWYLDESLNRTNAAAAAGAAVRRGQ